LVVIHFGGVFAMLSTSIEIRITERRSDVFPCGYNLCADVSGHQGDQFYSCGL
jgi:hypothetical protein